MKTSLNKLAVPTFLRLGKSLNVRQYNILPTDINKLNLEMEMNVEGIGGIEYIPVIYVWNWYDGITKIEKNDDTLALTIELAGIKRFSHIAIHFPAIRLLQIHRLTEVDLACWRMDKDWELSGGDKDLTVLSSNSYGG
ncbi:MAG: hypothetical protein ACOYMZ_03375 [Minisyncoccia bacterium]